MDKNIRTLVDLEANLKNTKTAITTIATRIGREERVVCRFILLSKEMAYATKIEKYNNSIRCRNK